MTSFKAWLFYWAIWFLQKGTFQSDEGMHKRMEQQRASPNDKPGKHIYQRHIITERTVGGFKVYDISPKSTPPSKARVLYIHGGALILEVTHVHFATAAALAEKLQATITMPVYTVGPDRTLEDLYRVFQPLHDEMATKGKTPFFLVGDSAGGTIATVLTQQALKAKKPTASRLVLICPVLDWTFTNPDAHKSALIDVLLDIPGCAEAVRLSQGKWATDDARVSPLFGDVNQMPPTMVFAAELDLLTPDIKLFVEKLRVMQREVVLVEGESMVHAWPILPMPEGDEARDRIVKWLEQGI